MKTKETAFVLKFQDGDSFSMLKIYSEKINIDIKRPEDITAESLSLFTIMEPPIEIVVVGTGDKLFRLDPKLHSYMRKQHNILLEVQATANASATFNFLLEETRLVGAVLIPPTSTDEL
ncbi:PREDICTED: NADH dehydrogenase [ubiquinone] 1 alpha subcomplex assembly factor 3-like isoform X3 [Acropora digitifera]|uniref:NADH dehydrogenase [ubiquinone] 1 alpha subcomplex assembly factor 3-like isoform X3 n=1 Tax=Acropora digitifera TaxID=70779 RepID=UPI00077A47CB|nr:PREDICTED: NADH dehydrogenase [ubiquinone] 1 alpha subcomplex assembly factor 3-like isoform X3 [Acropora digitifera]